MTGRGPAEFNFIDLSNEIDDDDPAPTSSPPRSAPVNIEVNTVNNASCSHPPLDPPEQGGSEQPHSDNAVQVGKRPMNESELNQNHLLGNHLTLASSYYQTVAELARLKQVRKDEVISHQKHLMMLQEASQEQAVIQMQAPNKKLLQTQAALHQQVKSVMVQQQAMIEQLTLVQRQYHAMIQMAIQATSEQAARTNMSSQRTSQGVHNAHTSHHRSTTGPGATQPNPPAYHQRSFRSPPPVPVSTWTSHQLQCPAVQASNSALRADGTAQMTVFYASMVNVFDNVSLEKAEAVRAVLTGQGNNRLPVKCMHCARPQKRGSTSQVPQARSVPTSSPPSIYTSAPSTSRQHISVQAARPPPPPQAPVSTCDARPSHSMQAPGSVISSVRQPPPPPPQARGSTTSGVRPSHSYQALGPPFACVIRQPPPHPPQAPGSTTSGVRPPHSMQAPGPGFASVILQPSPRPPQASAPTTSEATPSHSMQGLGQGVSGVLQLTVPAKELPQARKASLSRFLERRKDRARSYNNLVYVEIEEGLEIATSTGQATSVRSPSTVPDATPHLPPSYSGALTTVPQQPSAPKPPSPPTRPPTIPPPRQLPPSFSGALIIVPQQPSAPNPPSPPTRPPIMPPPRQLHLPRAEESPVNTSKRKLESEAEEDNLRKRAAAAGAGPSGSGSSRDVIVIDDDDNVPSTTMTLTTTEYVAREYDAVLKEFKR
ncbi:hypothetical protein KC19_5G058300 [Ceratodon purpureus]|uniref:Tify domain-containing protein n=1 Tax=Ceratodon purpureus TaxID=3225 RepID=A0A8T0HZ28_CERPU|nr:hypothetical protein KC19_5G058300 [Ceratodon purpureus]